MSAAGCWRHRGILHSSMWLRRGDGQLTDARMFRIDVYSLKNQALVQNSNRTDE